MTDSELNALVAEKVMGWKRAGADDYTSPKHGPLFDDWENKGSHKRLESPDGTIVYLCGCGGSRGGNIPDYCNDIAAAWRVVECLINDHEFELAMRKEYRAAFVYCEHNKKDEHPVHSAFAPTAPRAICLAALEAVG